MSAEELANLKISDIVTTERYLKHLKNEWKNKTKYPLHFRVKIRELYGAKLFEKMPYEYMAIIDKQSRLSAVERMMVKAYCESAFYKTMRELLDESKKEDTLGEN